MSRTETRNEQGAANLWQLASDDERRVVGACLIYPELFPRCGALSSAHFTSSDCRAVWSVMADLQKLGGAWDFASVASELASRGTSDAEVTLCQLTEGVVATTAIEWVAAKVREMSVRCRALKKAEDILSTLADPASDLAQVLHLAQRTVTSVPYGWAERAEPSSASKQQSYDSWAAANGKPPSGTSQGAASLALVQGFITGNRLDQAYTQTVVQLTVSPNPRSIQFGLKLFFRPENRGWYNSGR